VLSSFRGRFFSINTCYILPHLSHLSIPHYLNPYFVHKLIILVISNTCQIFNGNPVLMLGCYNPKKLSL
jgi:hypothetical protein